MYNYQKYWIDYLINQLNDQFDEAIIEGLSRKGFNFECKMEIEEFIKSRCRSEDYQKLQQKVFFVDDIPFMVYKYETKIDETIVDGIPRLTASYGTYSYI